MVFRGGLRYYIAHKSAALKERLSKVWSDWLEEVITPEQFAERLMSVCVENPRTNVTSTTYSAADGTFYAVFDFRPPERHGNSTGSVCGCA